MGVPVCPLFIIGLPGGPVLPPIVSSLPTLAPHPPEALREAVAPPGFPPVAPPSFGLKLLVPGVLVPWRPVFAFSPLPVPFIPLLLPVAFSPLLVVLPFIPLPLLVPLIPLLVAFVAPLFVPLLPVPMPLLVPLLPVDTRPSSSLSAPSPRRR